MRTFKVTFDGKLTFDEIVKEAYKKNVGYLFQDELDTPDLEWIDHNGGPCPIKLGDHVLLKTRAIEIIGFGHIEIPSDYDPKEMNWDHHDEEHYLYGGDIIAYAYLKEE